MWFRSSRTLIFCKRHLFIACLSRNVFDRSDTLKVEQEITMVLHIHFGVHLADSFSYSIHRKFRTRLLYCSDALQGYFALTSCNNYSYCNSYCSYYSTNYWFCRFGTLYSIVNVHKKGHDTFKISYQTLGGNSINYFSIHTCQKGLKSQWFIWYNGQKSVLCSVTGSTNDTQK